MPANPLWKPLDRRLGAAKSDLPRIAGFEARVSDALVGWSGVPWLPHHPGLAPGWRRTPPLAALGWHHPWGEGIAIRLDQQRRDR